MVYDTIFAEFLYNTSVYKVSHELLQTADSKDRQDTSGEGGERHAAEVIGRNHLNIVIIKLFEN